MKSAKNENYPLGYKFPRRVRVIAKRIKMPVNDLILLLRKRQIEVIGSTFLSDNQMLKIKDVIEGSLLSKTSFVRPITKGGQKRSIPVKISDPNKSASKSQRIMEKILEYQNKLEAKKITKVGRRTIKKNISQHLKSFYLTEIENLEKELCLIENSTQKKILIEWNDLMFEDYQIRARFDKMIIGPFQFKDSRESLNFLKPYFRKLNLNPIQCIIKDNEIVQIINPEEFYKAIQLFKFQKLTVDFSSWCSEDIEKQIEHLDNTFINSAYKPKDKANYLNYLIEIHHTEFKIIPLLENNNEKDDSFLFTFKRRNKISIIWESCLAGKATYLFETYPQNYMQTLLYLIKIIQSVKIQRLDIRQTLIRENRNNINCCFIYHEDFYVWKKQLTLKLQSTTVP